MYRTVIVGFDGSEEGDDALALGALIARTTGGSLTAAGVYGFRPLHGTRDARLENELREATRAQLDEAVRRVSDPRPTPAVLRAHSTAAGLQHLAEVTEADLIVVGGTHRGPIARAVGRGTAESLLYDAPCAVAVAPRGYAEKAPPQLERIGVAFDGGAESRAALDAAAALARTAGARLEVISVFDPAISWLTPHVLADLAYLEYEALVRRQAEQELLDAVGALTDVDATAVPAEGAAAAALVARTRALDLLVLGSRRYGAVQRVMLGSVSAALVRQAEGPVLVVPRAAEAPDEAPAEIVDAEATAAP